MSEQDKPAGVIAAGASWIWIDEPERRHNRYACFRRTFNVAGAARAARLRLTADARYEVFINGEWVGHGPPRSWPEPWPVDEYHLCEWLRPGRNTIAVLVTDFGIGTMQYLLQTPGLLAQVEWSDAAGSHRVVTDDAWRAHVHSGYAWPVPRASVPLAWEEQFDARTLMSDGSGWHASEFDDAAWPPARVLRPVGVPPHATLELRNIPQLTREVVEPTRLVAAETVTTAPHVWSLLLREELGLPDDEAGVAVGRLLVASYVHSPCEQEAELQDPHQLSPWVAALWKLNKQRFGAPDPGGEAFQDLSWGGMAVHRLRLRAGWNLLLARITEVQQVFRAVLSLRSEHPVTLHATPDCADTRPAPWLVLGPFGGAPASGSPEAVVHYNAAFAQPVHAEATAERFERIWERGELTEEDLAAPFTRRLRPEHAAPVDVFALCASEQVVAGAEPRVEEAGALLGGDGGWCTIHPRPDGDVRLLLDFGREIIGYHELEVDAPEGAVIDVHGFEFIQHDGRRNLAEGMNNTLRYVCREGEQRYRTFLRRGFRYCWVSVRRFDRPVHIRRVRALFSTYPFSYRGDFACSDPLLDRIWQVGVHTVRCCAEDTYTDCPSYEQTHWVGDARNEAQVDLLVNGDARLSRHCWIQAARSLDRSPIVESHVPSSWQNLLPAWSFLWMRWAREHHLLSGDDAFAREACPWLDRNVRGIEEHLNEDGLFEIDAWNMFDWAPMDTPPDAVVTHQNCLAVLGLRDAAALAREIGEAGRAEHWLAIAAGLTAAINRSLWDPHHQAYADCLRKDGTLSRVFSQQTQTAAYIARVAEGERARRCRQIMAEPPPGFVTAGSPFFMFFLLEALAGEDNIEQMVRVVRDYWGPQVEAGATAFWEMYHPEAQRMTRSHCHGWSAAPTVFLTQHVLGVQPLTPGYRRVRIAPGRGAAWAKGSVPTPHGMLHINWRRTGERLMLDLQLPPNVQAIIELPLTESLQVPVGRLEQLPSANGRVRLVTRTQWVRLMQQSVRAAYEPTAG